MTINDLYEWVETLAGGIRSIHSPEALRDYILDLLTTVAAQDTDLEGKIEALEDENCDLREENSELELQLETEREDWEGQKSALRAEIETLQAELAEARAQVKSPERN